MGYRLVRRFLKRSQTLQDERTKRKERRAKYFCGMIPFFCLRNRKLGLVRVKKSTPGKNTNQQFSETQEIPICRGPTIVKMEESRQLITLLALPIEIRYMIYDTLVREDCQIDILDLSEREDNFQWLSKTCHQVRNELQVWKQSNMKYRFSPTFGVYNVRTTVFYIRLNKSFHESWLSKDLFERFFREPAHSNHIEQMVFDFECGYMPTPANPIRFDHGPPGAYILPEPSTHYRALQFLERFWKLKKLVVNVSWLYKPFMSYSLAEPANQIASLHFPDEWILNQRPENFEMFKYEVYDNRVLPAGAERVQGYIQIHGNIRDYEHVSLRVPIHLHADVIAAEKIRKDSQKADGIGEVEPVVADS